MPAASWLLANAIENRSLMPITSPVDSHLGAEHDVDAGELDEREHAFLHRDVRGIGSLVMPCSASVTPAITLAAILATGMPVALATNGTVRLARGIHFQHVDDRAGRLPSSPRTARSSGRRRCSSLASASVASRISCNHRPRQAVRRNRAGRVARVDAGFFDVLHDAGDDRRRRRR